MGKSTEDIVEDILASENSKKWKKINKTDKADKQVNLLLFIHNFLLFFTNNCIKQITLNFVYHILAIFGSYSFPYKLIPPTTLYASSMPTYFNLLVANRDIIPLLHDTYTVASPLFYPSFYIPNLWHICYLVNVFNY